MKLSRKPGSTSNILEIFIADSSSTTGAGLTGLVYNSPGLTAYYHRESGTAGATAVTLADMTVGTFTSGGFKEIDATNMPGWYQFCPPNAALTTGARSVAMHLKGAANMVPLPLEVDLNSQVDVTHLDGTIYATQRDALVDLIWDEVLTGATHNVTNSAGQKLRQIGGNIVTSGTAQAGGTASITLASAASSSNGTYDPGLVRIVAGTGAGQSRFIIQYVGSTRVASVDRDWRVTPDNTSEYEVLASPNLISTNEGLAQGGTSTTITLNADASSVNDVYKGQTVVTRTGTGQDQSRIITAYNGTTKVATVATSWEVTPTSSTGYILWGLGRSRVASIEDGVITANSIATGALTAAKFASDSLTAIAAAIWNALTSGLSTVGSVGKLLVDNVNATISSRATASAQTTMQTDVTSILGDTNELQQDWVNGGRLDLILDARASQSSVDTVDNNVDELLLRLTSARAGYLDNLDIGEVVAGLSDIQALNQSASRRIVVQTVGQYEIPDAGETNTYSVEMRLYDEDGAAVNADTSPSMTPFGIISGSLAANLSASTNPSTGVYRWTYSVEDDAEIEQIRFEGSAVVNGNTFPMTAYTQVSDLVGSTWTESDRTKLVAIFNKLPSRNFLSGSSAATGAFVTADIGLASGNLDSQFTSLSGKVDVVDGVVDAILIDSNELQTDWTDGGRLDLILDARASQSSANAILADTNELQQDWADGGRLDLILDARASQTSVNNVQTGVNDIPTTAEMEALLDSADDAVLTAISALNDLDSAGAQAAAAAALTAYGVATGANVTAAKDVLEKIHKADITIDTGTTPWEMVWKESGTATELFRKKLKTTAGGNITSTTTPIGQAVA